MSSKDIYITEFDRKRLTSLLNGAAVQSRMDGEHLRSLRQELDRAILVDPRDVPADVVTMNSKVRLTDLKTGDEVVVHLVFPGEANFDQQKVSVLAPIGTAIIGCRLGEDVHWQVPAGMAHYRIEEIIYQPEAAGNYTQ